MKNLVIVACGRAAFRDAFDQNQLVALQLNDLALICTDHGGAVRLHDAVKKLADLLFHCGGFQFQRHAAFFRFLRAAIPKIAEHGGRKLHKLACRRQGAYKGFQRLLHLCPRYGLPVAVASMLAAHVIGVTATFSLGPCCGHGMVAIAAGDEAAHGEIGVNVLAGRRAGFACQTVLNEIEGFKGDQPFMLRFAQ